MAFDFKKVLDFINPSYAQLKNLLLASVSTIGMVWFISAKTTEFRAQTAETNKLVKESVENIQQIKEQQIQDRIDNKADLSKLYLDILDMNTRNNTYMNSKFSLLINYGNSNKNLLQDMIKSLDEQQKLYEQDRLKNMEYWNSIKPPLTKPDTTYDGNIQVRKMEPGDAVIIPNNTNSKPGVNK